MKKNLNEEMNTDKQMKKKSNNNKLLTIFLETLPILLERIMELKGRPTLKKLQEENEELKLRISSIEKKIFWFMIFVVAQTIFILFFIIYIILKSHI